jgi:uncharacterized metal-binding protein
MMDKAPYACAFCATTACLRGEFDKMPTTCPTRTQPEITRVPEVYAPEPIHAEMLVADAAPFTPEGELRNRVEEVIFYAKEQGFRRIGIAFCVSLTKESQKLGRMMREQGLETELVCCRVGAIDYDEIGLTKAHPERFAAICNPVAQAKLLNARAVDLVVQLGLCIGHDIILQRECAAPVTTLVVKDRVFDHHTIEVLR